jgi:hypothetical protein
MKDYNFRRLAIANLAYMAKGDRFASEDLSNYGIITVGSYEILA